MPRGGLNLCPACDVELADAAACPHCGTPCISICAGRDAHLGRVLDGRYEIRAVLGSGGMGTVYRAWQRSVDREVAVKLIHERYRRDVTWIRRFLREARLASRLRHPHTVGILDFGQTDEGDLFLAMELLEGRTLAEVLRTDGAFDVERTVKLGAQICDALSAAHDRGIVHRDLKPQNILILDEPSHRDFVKVLDFGLAKALGDAVDPTTELVGTPFYMAPELLGGEPPSPASDLYALGVMLCMAHLGRSPFASASLAALLVEKAGFTDLPREIGAPLRPILGELLAPNPARRPQRAADTRARLEGCLATAARGTQGTHPIAIAPTHSPPTRWPRRARGAAVLIAVAVLGVALVPGWRSSAADELVEDDDLPAAKGRELRRQVDAALAANAGAQRMNRNEIALSDGVVMTIPLPGERVARGPDEPLAAAGAAHCPEGQVCFYEHVAFEGRRLRFTGCGAYNLYRLRIADDQRWNDRISSWYNRSGARTSVHDWNGTLDWIHLFVADDGEGDRLPRTADDRADLVVTCI